MSKKNENGILRIGIPKGSLQESTLKFFAKAGFSFRASAGSYFFSIDDEKLKGVLVRAQEIAKYVEDGIFDMGLTGKDWILETRADVIEVADLLYAKQTIRPVYWVLAVPIDSPIKKIKDLQGKKIATEIVNLTRDFLSKRKVKAEVEFSWGATEIKAPLLADAIVEATETGNSLRANKLRVVETILESTTRVIVNKESWNDSWKKEKIENIVTLLTGAIQAEERVGLKMNVAREDLDKLVKILPAMKNPTISPLYDNTWVAVEIIVEEKVVRDLIPKLKRIGARDIIEYPLNKVIM